MLTRVLILVILSQVSFGLVTAQELSTEHDSDVLDCSHQPPELICPKRTIYRAGSNCTDSCNQKVCNTTMTCGCFCKDNFRKINGMCERKSSCIIRSPPNLIKVAPGEISGSEKRESKSNQLALNKIIEQFSKHLENNTITYRTPTSS